MLFTTLLYGLDRTRKINFVQMILQAIGLIMPIFQ
jgi:hypothetical protein